MASGPLKGCCAATLCLGTLLAAARAGAEGGAPEAATTTKPPADRPTVTVDESCKGFVFDRERLEEDVLLELGAPRAATPSLEVRCTQDLHAHVSERLEGVVLEQTLDLSSLPPSSWHRVLVLSFVEGAAALGARAFPDSGGDGSVTAAAQADPPAQKEPPPPGPTSAANELPIFGPSDLGGQEEDEEPKMSEVWLFGGGAARFTEQGGLVGANLGVRYRPLFVGVSQLFGESSEVSLSTLFVACALTPASDERWSPLIVPRVSGGLLSRAGAMDGGAYYAAYFDAGLWLGTALRFGDEWVLSGGLDGGYGVPTSVSGTGGSARAGGGYMGGILLFGARP